VDVPVIHAIDDRSPDRFGAAGNIMVDRVLGLTRQSA